MWDKRSRQTDRAFHIRKYLQGRRVLFWFREASISSEGTLRTWPAKKKPTPLVWTGGLWGSSSKKFWKSAFSPRIWAHFRTEGTLFWCSRKKGHSARFFGGQITTLPPVAPPLIYRGHHNWSSVYLNFVGISRENRTSSSSIAQSDEQGICLE